MINTGRKKESVNLVTEYSEKQKLVHKDFDKIEYKTVVEVNLDKIKPSLSGPKRPQDRFDLCNISKIFSEELTIEEKKVASKMLIL